MSAPCRRVWLWMAARKIVSGRGRCGETLWIAKPVLSQRLWETDKTLIPSSVLCFPIFFCLSHFYLGAFLFFFSAKFPSLVFLLPSKLSALSSFSLIFFSVALSSCTWIVARRSHSWPVYWLSDQNQTPDTVDPVANPVPGNRLERS